MADEKPVVVRKQQPGEAPAFEQELEERTKAARAKFAAAHPDVPVENPPAPSTVEPLAPEIKIETPPQELSEPREDAPPPKEEVPAPKPEPPPPAEAKTVEKREERPTSPQDFEGWRTYRRQERELRRAQRALSAAGYKYNADSGEWAPPTPTVQPAPVALAPPTQEKPPAAPTEQEPVEDDDPFGIKASIRAETDAALARIRDENQARWSEQERRDQDAAVKRYADDLTSAEKQYAEKDADYFPAVNHLVNWERQRFQLSGMAQNRAAQMMSDPRYQPVIERIADEYVFVPHPTQEGVLLSAKRDQLTPELRAQAREMSDAEAAIALATDLWVSEQRNHLLQSNRASEIPGVVMKLATSVAGYSRQTAPATGSQPPSNPAAGSNGVPPPATAAERIRQQARLNAASKSVTNLSSGVPGEPQPAQITSLREMAEFQRRDPAGARAYMDAMSRRDPNWHRNLSA